jgi:hypothetical protein
MLRRTVLSTCLVAAAIAIPAVAASTTSAAPPDQISVWSASGLRQTASSYWEPSLNQPADYTAPADYANGRAFIKIDVVSKPSDLAVVPLVCFWTHTEAKRFHYETCARGGSDRIVTGEGAIYVDLGAPAGWWKKNGTFDWSLPPSVGRIMIKKAYSTRTELLLSSKCGAACYIGDDLADHVPIEMDSELIFVKKGASLTPPTDWRTTCPADWSTLCSGGGATTTTTTIPKVTTTTTIPKATTTTTIPKATTTTTTPSGSNTASVAATATTPAVRLTSSSVGTIAATWSHPDAMRYQYRYNEVGSSTRVWSDSMTAKGATLTGLRSGKDYTVKVRAYYGGSWKQWATLNVRVR